MTVPDVPVEEVAARAYRIPTDAPEADGTIAWDATTMVVVEARAGGVTGLGWTYAAGAAAGVVDDLLAPAVRGRGALDPPGASDAMVKAVRNVGRAGIAGCAVSAVDVAIWDLKARLLDLSLHRLLGAVRQDVPVYGSGGFTTYDEARLAEQLGGWVQNEHIPRVKIKIGESWGTRVDRDLERIRQARDVIGEGADLFVDANGAYGAKQAVRVAEAAADANVTWFEEPVSSDDLSGLALVRSLVRPDVAAGEYIWDLTDARRMLAAGAVDCLQADASRCGGITEWLRVAALAAASNLQVSGHCAPHLHAAVAASVPNLRHLEWFHDHVRIESMAFDGTLDPAGGTIRPDDAAPGHGLTLREPDLEQYRVA
jgi:L-alanine-DL-glutamate epimerase-like enolase superfamily enzyme